MVMSAAQWAAIQATLPRDERTSYAEYLAGGAATDSQNAAKYPARVPGGITDSQNAARLAAAKTTANKAAPPLVDEDSYYTTKVGNTGKTQAQLDALANAKSTASMINEGYGELGIKSVVDPGTGRVVTDYSGMAAVAAKAAADAAAKAAAAKAEADRVAKAEADRVAADKAAKAIADAAAAAKAAAEEAARVEAARIAAEQAIRDAKNAAELKKAQDALAAAVEAARVLAEAKATAELDAVNAGNAVTTSSNTSTAASSSSYTETNNISSSGNTTLAATNTADTSAADYAKAAAALEKFNARQDALQVMRERFKQYGLGTLVDKIKDLAIDGATESTITFALQETPEYKERFKANAIRAKNNLAVLTPADYLNLEDGYRQIMKAYGLTQFNNDEYVSQFIANDVSATELNTRVLTAVQRIQNADPSITKTLRDYYNIQDLDLVSYILDPAKNIDKIQKQVSAAEIGSAARSQGLQLAESAASGLVAQGVTQKEAQLGYSNIAEILPTTEKLGSIYGNSYSQADAEKEVFGQLASAKRKRQDLTALEKAQFDTSSGMSRTSLTGTKPAGQY